MVTTRSGKGKGVEGASRNEERERTFPIHAGDTEPLQTDEQNASPVHAAGPSNTINVDDIERNFNTVPLWMDRMMTLMEQQQHNLERQQGNQIAQVVENRGPIADHLTVLEKFVKLGPTTFRGDSDAIKAELWIEEMEKIL